MKTNTIIRVILIFLSVLIEFQVVDAQMITKISVGRGKPIIPISWENIDDIQLKNATIGDQIIPEFPTYDWTYGCTPTAIGMILAYYTRRGIADVMDYSPLSNREYMISDYSAGEHPSIASKKDLEGRTGYGHVDDYWVSYGSQSEDPYVTNSRTAHQDDCIADFLGTSRKSLGITDGGTWLYAYREDNGTLGAKLLHSDLLNAMPELKYSAMAGVYNYVLNYKGKVITQLYTQNVTGAELEDSKGEVNTVMDGFSFADYQKEIDNGWPVLLNLWGHSSVGIGYRTSNGKNEILLKDTWTWKTEKYNVMEWDGGLVCGNDLLPLESVTVIHLTQDNIPMGIGDDYKHGPTAPTLDSVVFDPDLFVADLNWTSNDLNSKYYAVYRCLEGESITNDDFLAFTDETSFTDNLNGFLPGSTFNYVIAAVNESGYEGYNSQTLAVSLFPCNNTFLSYMSIDNTVEYECNNIYISDMTIESGDVTFDIGNSLEIYSDFSIELGATLVIE